MGPNGLGQQGRVSAQTSDIETDFERRFVPQSALSFDHHQGREPPPFMNLGPMRNLRDGHGPHLPMFHPMMPGFGPVAIAKLNVAPLGRFGLLKERFHPLIERPLIAFEGQNVVPFLLNALGGNIPLGSHGIQRDNRPFDIQETQQCWNRGNLIRFALDLTLGQHQVMLRSPRTHRM